MFSLFIMPKRRTFGHFLASSEDIFFLVKKEDMSSKRRTDGKPTKVIFSAGSVSTNGTSINSNAGRFADLVKFCETIV